MPCTCVLYAKRMHCVCSWACASYAFKTFFGRFKVDAHSHGTFLEKWGMRSTCSMRIRIARAGHLKCACALYVMCIHCICSWACASYAIRIRCVCSWACASYDFKTFFVRFKVHPHAHGTFLEKWGMCSTCSMRIRIARAGRLKCACALYVM